MDVLLTTANVDGARSTLPQSVQTWTDGADCADCGTVIPIWSTRAVHLMPVVTCLQAVIQLRLGYPPAKWRNVYKALTLLDFLLKRGPENCVRITKQDLLHRLQDLEGFQFVSTDGKDLGANVRLRCLRCLTLVYVVHKATEVLA